MEYEDEKRKVNILWSVMAGILILSLILVFTVLRKDSKTSRQDESYEEYTEALHQATEVILILNERLQENQKQTDRLEMILSVYERERLKGAPTAPSTPIVHVDSWIEEDKPNLVESYHAIQEGRLQEYLEEKEIR